MKILPQCCVEWRPLTCGKPIHLMVTPKDVPESAPTLSILLPASDGPEVCLAAGFAPKKDEMQLNLSGDKRISLDVTGAKLASSRTYYYAGYAKEKIQSCRLGAVQTNWTTAIHSVRMDDVTIQPPQLSCPNISSSDRTFITDGPRVNFMSLQVTGLRILFAKTVVINVLMTIRTVVA